MLKNTSASSVSLCSITFMTRQPLVSDLSMTPVQLLRTTLQGITAVEQLLNTTLQWITAVEQLNTTLQCTAALRHQRDSGMVGGGLWEWAVGLFNWNDQLFGAESSGAYQPYSLPRALDLLHRSASASAVPLEVFTDTSELCVRFCVRLCIKK